MKLSNENESILNMVINNKSIEEICNKHNLTYKQLKLRLTHIKNSGFNIEKKYFYDGCTSYVLDKSIPKKYTIIHNIPKSDATRMVAISDTHIGSKYENIDYIKLVYEYCTNNEIHIIINGGDLLEGMFNHKQYNLALNQIKHLLKDYPFDSRILNFIALGNHDEDFLKTYGLDIHQIITRNRDDLISLGYDTCYLKIADNMITLNHIARNIGNYISPLKITGHGHRYQFKIRDGHPVIFLPTLSDEIKDNFLPGFVELDLLLDDKEEFSKIIVRQFVIIDKKIIPSSNSVFTYKRM